MEKTKEQVKRKIERLIKRVVELSQYITVEDLNKKSFLSRELKTQMEIEAFIRGLEWQQDSSYCGEYELEEGLII